MTGGSRARPSPWLLAALIFGLTVLAYLPSLRGQVLWDDTGHVTKPELQSLEGLFKIWFVLGASQQYYPVLHTAFWAEHRLWGDATAGYHLVNMLLHAASACLLALVLQKLARRPDGPAPAGTLVPDWPWIAALLFALHPVCVESVAWISEQKNTLSGFFYLLAARSFLGCEEEGRSRWGRLGLYLLASLLFFLALLSKTVTATLPAALLVALWWRDGRLSLRRHILPLLPWFALGAVMGLFTAWVERNVVGAEGGLYELSLGQRALLAGRVIWFYLGKDLWPFHLIFVYPRWTVDAGAWWQYLFPLGIAALILALGLHLRRRGSSRATRAPLAGFLFFAGTLFPVLGFFNIYPFRFSYVADHFQYLASIGILSLAAGGLGWVLARPGLRQPAPVLGALVLLLAALSWKQCHAYRTEETLYRATLAENPGCWMAENNLGTYLTHQSGRSAEAIGHFRRALQLKPDYPEGHNNLGSEYSKIPGRLPEAIAELEEAVRINPRYPDARNNLGLAYAQAGRLGDAELEFREAIRLKPDYPEAHNDLGIALGETGRLDESIAEIEEALRLRPNYGPALKNLGVALSHAGRLREAIAAFKELGRLEPGDPEAQRILAAIRAHEGSLDGQ